MCSLELWHACYAKQVSVYTLEAAALLRFKKKDNL